MRQQREDYVSELKVDHVLADQAPESLPQSTLHVSRSNVMTKPVTFADSYRLPTNLTASNQKPCQH